MIATRPFDLDAALSGTPFIHRFDVKRPDAERHTSTVLIPVSHPNAPNCWLAFCSEWVVFDTDDEMYRELFLVVPQEGTKHGNAV